MEKIQITQFQKDDIQRNLNEKSELKLLKEHIDGYFVDGHSLSLKNIGTEDLIKVLYVPDSYEVIPQYKVGNWVVNIYSGEIGQVEAIRKVGGAVGNDERIVVDSILNYPDSLRHATPEEEQQEKKRRFWEKLGREVDEYKQGDIVTTGFGNYTSITKLEMNKKSVYFDGPEAERSFDEIYLVAPEEQRMDK